MAYWFTGFFAQPRIVAADTPPPGALWKEIVSPFLGVGVRLPQQYGEKPEAVKIEAIAEQLGFDTAESWIFLHYVCWGGRIDFVYGLGQRRGVKFGPVEESDLSKVKDVYIRLMAQFGIPADVALDFEPFKRGYWGDS
jgi:hypothetical protein